MVQQLWTCPPSYLDQSNWGDRTWKEESVEDGAEVLRGTNETRNKTKYTIDLALVLSLSCGQSLGGPVTRWWLSQSWKWLGVEVRSGTETTSGRIREERRKEKKWAETRHVGRGRDGKWWGFKKIWGWQRGRREQRQQLAHSWWLLNHCAAPPSTGRSEELPPPSSLLGSFKLLCNKAGRGTRGVKWGFNYLLWNKVVLEAFCVLGSFLFPGGSPACCQDTKAGDNVFARICMCLIVT